jgi:hypothetical protein
LKPLVSRRRRASAARDAGGSKASIAAPHEAQRAFAVEGAFFAPHEGQTTVAGFFSAIGD